MSVEALLGTDRAFAEDLIALRPQPGQAASAANLRALLAGSAIVASHRDGDPRVQDAYSLRCAPQVNGAARDTLAHAERVAEARAALGDRQPDGAARRPRRVVRQLPRRAARRSPATSWRSPPPTSARSPSGAPTGCSTPARSHGLPPFLAADPGVDSGLMIAQYTQAAMVAENRRLAAPASVDSLPTSAMQEDHVSMGWGAARKLRLGGGEPDADPRRRAVLRGARARPARAARARARDRARRWSRLRSRVPGPGPDRFLAPELAAVEALVSSGEVLSAVEGAVGALR